MEKRKHFTEQVEAINREVLQMDTLTEEAIGKALEALKTQDTALADKVIEEDEPINQMEVDLCDKCAVAIATEQPVATDLRHLIGAIRIVTDMERIGDFAAHIAKMTKRMAHEAYLKPLIDIPRMAEIAQAMLHDAVTSFLEGDVDLACRAAARDDEIDDINNQIFRELLTYMMEDQKSIQQATNLLLLSRSLERMGDHVTNICEWVIFTYTGEHKDL